MIDAQQVFEATKIEQVVAHEWATKLQVYLQLNNKDSL